LALLLLLASSAVAGETGYPLITLFRQEQHKGGTQNFGAAGDPRGRLYFANQDGVLIYDGAWWSRVTIAGITAFDVLSDTDGNIGVGGLEEIGVLAPTPTGTLGYRSLVGQLPAELRSDIGQGSMCRAPGGGLLFIGPRFAARWDGRALRVVERNNDPALHPRRCFDVGGIAYIGSFTGLKELGGKTLFAGKRIDIALPGFVILRNGGLFRYDETPYDTDASQWLRGKGVMDAKVLADGRIAVATLRFGLLIMTADGRIDQIIDAAAGLPDVFLFSVEQDAEGSLWLAMDNAIVRVDFGAPVSVFDQRIGLAGSVQTIARHQGTLYAGTSHGIFAIEPSGAGVRARRLPGMETNNPWSLLSTHDDFLTGTFGGIFVLHDPGTPQLIDGTTELTAYVMTPSLRDPSRVWFGTDEGVGMLRRDAGGWRYEGLLKTAPAHVHAIIETNDGALWIGTSLDGVVRIDQQGPITRWGTGEASVLAIDGQIIIVRSDGFTRPAPNGREIPDPLLGAIHTTGTALSAAADARGNVWMTTRPPRMVRRTAGGAYEAEGHLVGAMEGDGQTFFADADGVMWIGGDRGLYRVAAADATARRAQPAPAIRRVVDGRDRTLFDALGDPNHASTSLPHSVGRVRIEVAPLSYRDSTRYQYRLDPVDTQWSSWTEQAFLDYTNLGANDYTFRVRTRGAGGALSEEAHWSFSVRAPWYATRPAIALWIVTGAALLYLFIRLRTRTLRGRARRLQSLVDEQTVMLRAANEQLEHLSLTDPLTGVANRRAFDRALNEAWKRAVRHDQPLTVVMLDLDHFKRLNDAQGHAAGDECLRTVAQQLDSAIRGNGDDLVARWGGEEFVLLLAADEATALAVAQRIRAGIEPLGVTASLGVAARGNEADPMEIVERADRALYAAKRAGRNQVHVDVERLSA
jgi:diguanylate cyclase (GGDEF)-like protein